MKGDTPPSIRFYRAKTLRAVIEAQREQASAPNVEHGWILKRGHEGPVKGGLRDPETFPDQWRSDAVITLPVPVIHPVALVTLAKRTGFSRAELLSLAGESWYLENGKPVEYSDQKDLMPLGILGLVEHTKRVIAGGHPRAEDLFTWRIPVPPLCVRMPSTPWAVHPIDAQLQGIFARAFHVQALLRVKAPEIIVCGQWRVLQEHFENVVARLTGDDADDRSWFPMQTRRVATFLRSDKGKNVSSETLWKWALGPRAPIAAKQREWFLDDPWATTKNPTLGVVLLEHHVAVVSRDGIRTRRTQGRYQAWGPLIESGPLRPLSSHGEYVTLLPSHSSGNYILDAHVLDVSTGKFSDKWPRPLPRNIVAAYSGAKALAIWDVKLRRMRMLRHGHEQDRGHFFASPDGALVWLTEDPAAGIIDVDQRTCRFDLTAIGLERATGTFPRALVALRNGAMRIFARGTLWQDNKAIWTIRKRVSAAAFDRTGARLALVVGKDLRLLRLAPNGVIKSETSERLPDLGAKGDVLRDKNVGPTESLAEP